MQYRLPTVLSKNRDNGSRSSSALTPTVTNGTTTPTGTYTMRSPAEPYSHTSSVDAMLHSSPNARPTKNACTTTRASVCVSGATLRPGAPTLPRFRGRGQNRRPRPKVYAAIRLFAMSDCKRRRARRKPPPAPVMPTVHHTQDLKPFNTQPDCVRLTATLVLVCGVRALHSQRQHLDRYYSSIRRYR